MSQDSSEKSRLRNINPNRLKEYLKEIDRKREGLEQLSDAIWGFAETAFSEYKSVETLKDFLKAEGFELTDHAYGVETAFTASFGQGKPRIGILGEFDALSGMSQKADSLEKEPLISGASGHGCGHNLLGAGSVAAALSVKNYLEDGHEGTVIFTAVPGRRAAPARRLWQEAGPSGPGLRHHLAPVPR